MKGFNLLSGKAVNNKRLRFQLYPGHLSEHILSHRVIHNYTVGGIQQDKGLHGILHNSPQICFGLRELMPMLLGLIAHRLQLGICNLKLFICGLQLLIRGLQLFIRGLKLLIQGLQLLIQGLQLLGRGFQLFDIVLQMFACSSQLKLELLFPRGGFFLRRSLHKRLNACQGYGFKNHHIESVLGAGVKQRPYAETQQAGLVIRDSVQFSGD